MQPDEITARLATVADQEFCFVAKAQALGPYVKEVWGWDDAYQRTDHANRFLGHFPNISLLRGEPIGTWHLQPESTYFTFNDFYLLPQFQRRGIGSIILKRVIAEVRATGLPLRLRFIKINPVRSLYLRNGFEIVSETETHCLCERAP
jgi:GNAT superfamily N-acetyltransferase